MNKLNILLFDQSAVYLIDRFEALLSSFWDPKSVAQVTGYKIRALFTLFCSF